MNRDLQRFVRDALGRGLPRPAIRDALRQAGWRDDEIDAALAVYAETDLALPVPRRRPSLSARDTFLYLILFATLYTTAYNVGQILFGVIERWLPDPAINPYVARNYRDWVRSATAGVIIAFPIYLWLSRVIGRETAREPEGRSSPARKWLTYITLFVAALVIISDLIVLVQRMLSGELPIRFALKVAVVFAIACTVFWHYLSDLRREETDGTGKPGRGASPLARAVGALVIVVMLAGLTFSGSPRHERMRRMDEQRVQSLQGLSTAIHDYYASSRRLPDSLGVLLQIPSGLSDEALRDPESRERYTYRTVDATTYELCARFALDNSVADARAPGSDFWKHGSGIKCFQFTVRTIAGTVPDKSQADPAGR